MFHNRLGHTVERELISDALPAGRSEMATQLGRNSEALQRIGETCSVARRRDQALSFVSYHF